MTYLLKPEPGQGRSPAIQPGTPLAIAGPGFASWTARPGAAVQRKPSRFGADVGYVAIIPICGFITHRASLRQQILGGTSIEKLTAQFREALADPGVKAIVFDMDSAGGEVAGTPEFADEIFRSRSKKKTIAVANSAALAGAFWIASAAGELVVTPSGQVGSIGIFAAHEDVSAALEKAGIRISLIKAGRFKTDGNPYEPLSDTGRSYMQKTVTTVHDHFVAAVARGRRVSQDEVRRGFGQGRSVFAHRAVVAGMADRVETLDQTISRLASGRHTEPNTVGSFRLLGESFLHGEAASRENSLEYFRNAPARLRSANWQADLERRRRELDLL